MNQRTRDDGPLAFAERLLGLLDQGSFTATYKYAVLLGLIDLCMEQVSPRGDPSDVITTRQLAQKVLELYWPHTVPYLNLPSPDVLRQNTRGQAEIVTAIRRFREALDFDPLAPLQRAQRAAPKRFETLARQVEWKLIEMPLPRFQVAGGIKDCFVFEIGWQKDVSLAEVRRYQRGDTGTFDNRIQLGPRVAEYLVQLNGVLRPFVHHQWAAMVAKVNRLEEAQLERFLFGAERADLQAVRAALKDFQKGVCFYCGRSAGREGEVDHFIPWSRYPDDGLDNLVLADRDCNGKKRDFLASADHARRWRFRMEQKDIEALAQATSWHRNPEATLGVARAIYLGLPEGVTLWDGPDSFTRSNRTDLEGALR